MKSASHFNRFLQWSTVAILYSVCFFIRISPNTLQSSLKSDLNLSYSDIGVLSASFYYTYGLFQVAGALLSKKIGIHRCFTISLFFLLLGLFRFSIASTFASAFLGRILMGAGASLTFIYSLSVARRLFLPKNFPFYVGLTNFMGMVGALSAQTPLELLLIHWPWQKIFFGIFIIVFCLLPGLLWTAKPWDRLQENSLSVSSLKEDWSALWSARKFFLFWASMALVMIAPLLTIPEMWGELYLKTIYSYEPIHSSIVLSAFFVGVACGSLSLGLVVNYIPMRKLIPILLLGECLCLGLLLSPYIITPPFMTFSAFGIGYCASGMLLFFSLLESTFGSNALSIPLFNMFIMIGSSAFQPIIGSLLDHLSPIIGLSTALILSLSLLPATLGLAFIVWIIWS